MPGTGRKQGSAPFFRAAAIVFRMAISVALLAYLGDWLDRTLNTAPWMMVAGMVLGVVLVLVDLEFRASVRRKRKKKIKRRGSVYRRG